MIRIITSRGHGYTHAPLAKARPGLSVRVLDYDRLIRSRRFPRVPHVFTDLDRLSAFDLELAAIIHHGLRARRIPVYNDPARAKTRFALLRALHAAGVNDFNAYRVDEGVRPERYPVFLRRESGHGRLQSDLLHDWDAARQAVDVALEKGIPASNLILVEYAAEPVAPDRFRKLALWRVGDRYAQAVSVHDRQWIVKYGFEGAGGEAQYREDLRFIREGPFADALGKAFEIAGIEYGRADFGLVGGRPQVYEINTNPSIGGAEIRHRSELRKQSQREAWNAYLDALVALDRPRRGLGGVQIRNERLARHRGPHWRGPRTRRTP
ncbi:MAG: hypothetical protein ACQGVC_04690 [Myxococcota bacterium]